MNRLLFNRSCVLPSSLFWRSYSVKPLTQPFNKIIPKPSQIVYKSIHYQLAIQFLKQFSRKNASYAPLNIDVTNLTKDVIIFKHNNPKYFKLMNIFGIMQFFFWLICAEFTLSNLRDVPVNKESPKFEDLPVYLKINLGENKYKYGIAAASFSLGFLILGFIWMYTLRSVRYLILRKGGAMVSFVTYGPFGTNRIVNVPLNCVSAVRGRDAYTSGLPIKVKSKPFHYLLDRSGEFTNPQLFDHVINVKRRI